MVPLSCVHVVPGLNAGGSTAFDVVIMLFSCGFAAISVTIACNKASLEQQLLAYMNKPA